MLPWQERHLDFDSLVRPARYLDEPRSILEHAPGGGLTKTERLATLDDGNIFSIHTGEQRLQASGSDTRLGQTQWKRLAAGDSTSPRRVNLSRDPFLVNLTREPYQDNSVVYTASSSGGQSGNELPSGSLTHKTTTMAVPVRASQKAAFWIIVLPPFWCSGLILQPRKARMLHDPRCSSSRLDHQTKCAPPLRLLCH